MNITVTTQRDRRRRHVFMISQSEDSAYHPDDTIIPHNAELTALDTISVHEYSSPKCLPLRKLRKRLLHLLWRGWIMLAIGVIVFVLGLALGVVYFCIRGVTSTLKYTETVPTYVPAILLLVTGILCSIFYWRRYESYAAGSLVLCILMAPFCAVCAILTSIQHINRIHNLHNCAYTPPSCLCFGIEGHRYEFEVKSCSVMFGSLLGYVNVKLGLYCAAATWCFIGAILCLLLLNFCRPVRHLYSEDDRRLLAEHGVNTMTRNNSTIALEEITADHPSNRRDSVATVVQLENTTSLATHDNIFERLHGEPRTNTRQNEDQQYHRRTSRDTTQFSRFITLPGEPQCCLLGIRRNDSVALNRSNNQGRNELPCNLSTNNDESENTAGVGSELERVNIQNTNNVGEARETERVNVHYRHNLLREFNAMQQQLIRTWLNRCQLPSYSTDDACRHGDNTISDTPIRRQPVRDLPTEPVQRRPSQQLPSHPRQRCDSMSIPDRPVRRFTGNRGLPDRPIRRDSTTNNSQQLPPLPITRRHGNQAPVSHGNPLQVRIDYHEHAAPSGSNEANVNFTDELYRLLRESMSQQQNVVGCRGDVMLVPVPFFALPEDDPPPPYCSRAPSTLSGGGRVSVAHSSSSSGGSHISITAEIPVA